MNAFRGDHLDVSDGRPSEAPRSRGAHELRPVRRLPTHPALAERFCAEVPTAKRVWIEDCKTLVCSDQPERLAQLISDFIGS
jgi:hypothetical protein